MVSRIIRAALCALLALVIFESYRAFTFPWEASWARSAIRLTFDDGQTDPLEGPALRAFLQGFEIDNGGHFEMRCVLRQGHWPNHHRRP